MSARCLANVEIQGDQPSAEYRACHPRLGVVEVLNPKLLSSLLIEAMRLVSFTNEEEVKLLSARGVASKEYRDSGLDLFETC